MSAHSRAIRASRQHRERERQEAIDQARWPLELVAFAERTRQPHPAFMRAAENEEGHDHD